MRDYFIKTMKELRALTGTRQMEFLSPEETKMVLDKLCSVSQQFGYIPEGKQQSEVDKQIIEDPEFVGLNPKIFYKWMFRIAEPYWKSRITEEELTPTVEPLQGEEREYWLNVWKETLAKVEMKYTKGERGGTRLKEYMDKIAPKPNGTIIPMSAEEVRAHELHIQWIKESFDPITREKLPGYLEENEWNTIKRNRSSKTD